MFRSFGLDEKIAGNLREKQRALNAAETAEQYAEYWLTAGGGSANSPRSSSARAWWPRPRRRSAATRSPRLAALPWQSAGNPVGVTYTPAGNDPHERDHDAGVKAAITRRRRSISQYLGTNRTAGTIYQIDAQGYGGSPDTVAVVESTYIVQSSVKDLGSNQ